MKGKEMRLGVKAQPKHAMRMQRKIYAQDLQCTYSTHTHPERWWSGLGVDSGSTTASGRECIWNITASHTKGIDFIRLSFRPLCSCFSCSFCMHTTTTMTMTLVTVTRIRIWDHHKCQLKFEIAIF